MKPLLQTSKIQFRSSENEISGLCGPACCLKSNQSHLLLWIWGQKLSRWILAVTRELWELWVPLTGNSSLFNFSGIWFCSKNVSDCTQWQVLWKKIHIFCVLKWKWDLLQSCYETSNVPANILDIQTTQREPVAYKTTLKNNSPILPKMKSLSPFASFYFLLYETWWFHVTMCIHCMGKSSVNII